MKYLHHKRCSDKFSINGLHYQNQDFCTYHQKRLDTSFLNYFTITKEGNFILNSVPVVLFAFYALIYYFNTLLLSLPQEAHFIVAILWYEKNWPLFHYSKRLLNDILWHFFGQIKKRNSISGWKLKNCWQWLRVQIMYK